MSLSIMSFSITPLSIMSLVIIGLFATLSTNGNQHNDIQHYRVSLW
jgi:hypothetical protein